MGDRMRKSKKHSSEDLHQGKRGILVVDDQAGMRLTLKGILTRKGFYVDVAESGEGAVDAVLKGDYRIVFMDIKMPGMSGVDAFIKIKESKPDIQVIMMTAHAVDEEINQAIREGVYAVVLKPFEVEEILQIIQDCLQKQKLALIVDDQAQDCEKIRSLLSDKGYKTVTIGVGESSLWEIRQRQFEMIFFNVELPDMDPINVLKQIKYVQPHSKVIILSRGSDSLIQEAKKIGIHSVLNKPLQPQALEESIR